MYLPMVIARRPASFPISISSIKIATDRQQLLAGVSGTSRPNCNLEFGMSPFPNHHSCSRKG